MIIFKKLNARGFTLVELIATIALLAVIVMISFVSINAVINNNKERQYKNLISSIKLAAKQYASDCKYNHENNSTCKRTGYDWINGNPNSIYLSDLNNYLSSPVKNPKTNEVIAANTRIDIFLNNGKVSLVEIAGME